MVIVVDVMIIVMWLLTVIGRLNTTQEQLPELILVGFDIMGPGKRLGELQVQ